MPDGIAVTGRVQLPNGGPAAGAVVWCYLSPPSVSLRGSVAVSPAAVALTADANGVFTGDLVEGRYGLRIEWNGRWWSAGGADLPGPVFAGPSALTADPVTAEWRDAEGDPATARLVFLRKGAAVVSGVILLPAPITVDVGADGVVAASLIAGDYDVSGQAQGARLRTFATAAPGDWLAGGVPVGPVNTVAPAVTGNPFVGQTLTRTLGTWTGTGTITHATQWLRGGAAISGATGATYVQQEADAGQLITARVTATDSEGSRSAVSNAVATSYPQPVAAGALADVTVDQDSGDWTVAAAADFTGVGLTYALQSGPPGTSVNASTGLVTGTSANVLNAAAVVVRASTPDGKFADSGFSVTVQAVAPGDVAPTITADFAQASYTAGDIITGSDLDVVIVDAGSPAVGVEDLTVTLLVDGVAATLPHTTTAGETVQIEVTASHATGPVLVLSDQLTVTAVAEPQEITITADFDGGRAASMSATDALVQFQIDTDPVAGSRWFAVRLDNCAGKQPTIRVNGFASTPNFTDGSGGHKVWWSDDPTGDIWHLFDNKSENVSGNMVLSNNAPFVADTIYVCRHPFYPNERFAAKVSEWINNPLTSPTESAIEGYRILTHPATRDVQDRRDIPAIDAFAFKIGTGPMKAVLTHGIHQGERVADWMFEGGIDWLLSEDGAEARALATWYCYPNINAPGRFVGYNIACADLAENHNRIWGTGLNTLTRAPYQAVWATDLAGQSVRFIMDYHNLGSQARATPFEVWWTAEQFTGDRSAELRGNFSPRFFLRESSGGPNTCRRYVLDTHGSRDGVAAYSVEGHVATRYDLDDWRTYGRDLLINALPVIATIQGDAQETVTPTNDGALIEGLPPIQRFAGALPTSDGAIVSDDPVEAEVEPTSDGAAIRNLPEIVAFNSTIANSTGATLEISE